MYEYSVKKCASFAFVKNIKHALPLYKPELKNPEFEKLFVGDSSSEPLSVCTSVDIPKLDELITSKHIRKALVFVELGKRKTVKRRVMRDCDDEEVIRNFRYGDLSEQDARMYSNFVLDALRDKVSTEQRLSNAILTFMIELYKVLRDGSTKRKLLSILNEQHESTVSLERDYPIEFVEETVDDDVTTEQFNDIRIRIDGNDDNYSNKFYKQPSDQLQKAAKGQITQLEAFSKSEFVVIHGKKSSCIERGHDINQNYAVIDSLARNGVTVAPDTGKELSMFTLMRCLGKLESFHVVFIHSALIKKSSKASLPNETEPTYKIGKGEITAVAYRYLMLKFFPYMAIPDESDREVNYLF